MLKRVRSLFLVLVVGFFYALSFSPVQADCVPAGSPKSDTIVCSDADTNGVQAEGGNDRIDNSGAINVTESSSSAGTSVQATGIAGGDGNDLIVNGGVITVEAFLTQNNPLASPLNAGTAPDADSPAEASVVTAVGINGGDGKDTITNDGTITVDSTISITNQGDVSFSLTGGEDVDASTVLDAHATGIAGGKGADQITNNGAVAATATAEIENENSEVNLVDRSHANTSTFVNSNATGIDGGDDSDQIGIGNIGTITATALSVSNSSAVEVNLADWAVSDALTEVNARATGIDAGSGHNQVDNAGSVKASATSQVEDFSLNASFLDITAFGEGVSDLSTTLEATAVGIDSAKGKDDIDIATTGSVEAAAVSNAHSLGISLASEGVPGSVVTLFEEGGLASIGINSNTSATGVATGQHHDYVHTAGEVAASATSTASQESINVGIALLDFHFWTPGIVLGSAGTGAEATTTGIDTADGHDKIVNTAHCDVDAQATAEATTVSINIAEFSADLFPSLPSMPPVGFSLVVADTVTEATATATGIDGGSGHDQIENTHLVEADAIASSGSNSATASLDIKYEEGDNFFAMDAVGARATTIANAVAVGVDGGSGKDDINNSGRILAGADADGNTVSVGVAVSGTLQGAGGGLNLAATDTSTIGTAAATGIQGGEGSDRINNSGTVEAISNAEVDGVNVSVTAAIAEKGLAAGLALARSESEADASAIGIDGGGDGDFIENTGTVTGNATADASAVAVSVNIDGTSRGVSGGAALVEAGTMATADATGIRAGGSTKCEQNVRPYHSYHDSHSNDNLLANSGTVDVDAQANTLNVGVSAEVALAERGVAIGAALADTSSKATSTATAMEADGDNNDIVNAGDIHVKSSADTTAVSVSLTVAGATSGFAAGAALTDSSVTANAGATAIEAGEGNDHVTNSGLIAVDEAESSATAVSVSAGVFGVENGVALGAALGRTEANAVTNATAIDGGKADDTLINSGTIAMENVNAHADAVGVSLSVGIAQNGLGVSGALVDGDSTATVMAIGINGGSGDDALINNDTIVLRHGEAEALAVSVGVNITGTENGAAFGGALADADATANLNATGITGESGGDTIVNKGSVTVEDMKANADAVGVSASLTVAQNGVAAGGAFALTGTTANAVAKGIDAGDGEDLICSQGDGGVRLSNITSEGDAVGVSVGLAGGSAGLFVSAGLADASGKADTTATAIDGGAHNDTVINQSGILLNDLYSDANAASVSVALSGTSSGVAAGVGIANTCGMANTQAWGLEGGSGKDKVYNNAELTLDGIGAHANATGVSVQLGVTGAGVSIGGAVADSYAAADTTVQAMDGGTGDDLLVNESDVLLRDIKASANSTSVGVSLNGAIQGGVAAGLSIADTSSHANLTAIGMSGGEGDDKLYNMGSIRAQTVESNVDATGVSVSGQVSFAGAAGGAAIADTSASATTAVTGMDGGDGDDFLYNQGSVDVAGNSKADALSVGVSISAAVGLAGGATITDASTTVDTTATGIEGGAGHNGIFNEGAVFSTSAAEADSTSISVGISAGFGGNVTLADAQSSANASAVGIQSGIDSPVVEGDATISQHMSPACKDGHCGHHENHHHGDKPVTVVVNNGPVTTAAISDSEGTSVSTALVGFALGETTNTSTANAAGILTGESKDAICNSGPINASADATASGLSVAVNLIGKAMGDAGTTAEALAEGIHTGGGGGDMIENLAAINVDARSDASSQTVSVGLVGVSEANTSNTATAEAMGINSGDGDDIITNRGSILVSAGDARQAADDPAYDGGAQVASNSVSVNLGGSGEADASSTANALAFGIDSGEGKDYFQNLGGVTVRALAKGDADSTNVTIFGAGDANASSMSNAVGVGIRSGSTKFAALNSGTVDVGVAAETYAESTGVTIIGSAESQADTTTNAQSVGIETADGKDCLVNSDSGTILASAKAISTANSSSWNFAGGSSAQATLQSNANATGIASGDGRDKIKNQGLIDIDTESRLTAIGSGDAIFGNAEAGSQIIAQTTATGIDSGNDNDLIINDAQICVQTNATMTSNQTSVAFAGSASTDELITAANRSTGITGGEGADTIYNSGQINVDASSDNRSLGGAEAKLAGSVKSSGKISAEVAAIGISSGSEKECVFNEGVINVVATIRPWATHDSGAGFFYSNAGTVADVVARVTANGVTAGDTDSLIDNSGDILVTASSGAAGQSGGHAVQGVFSRAAANGGDFDFLGGAGDASAIANSMTTVNQAGILAGNGDNLIRNTGTLTVNLSEAHGFQVNTQIAPIAGSITTAGDAWGTSTAKLSLKAAGIQTGSGDNTIYNGGSITVTANPQVFTDTYTVGDGTGNGNSTVIANSDIDIAGILTGSGANCIVNDTEGLMRVTANFLVHTNSHVSSGGGADANADANNRATGMAIASGISTGNGPDNILNRGRIEVKATADGEAKSSTSGGSIDGDARAHAFTTVTSYAYGIRTGSFSEQDSPLASPMPLKDDYVVNKGDIIVTALADAYAETWAEEDAGGTSDELADSKTTAISYGRGIQTGTGDDTISSNGLISINATANTNTVVDTEDNDREYWSETSESMAYGIDAGEGNNTVFHCGELQVNATATAKLESIWDLGFVQIPIPGGDADSQAVGVYAENGDNIIVNDGSISVTATASGDSLMTSATAYGVKTGDGNDTIINNGTINTTEWLSTSALGIDSLAGNTSAGTAIASGGGDDTVVLGDGSVTNGDIDLGTGNDALSLEGTPVINGSVTGDNDNLSLVFNNSGSYDGGLPGVRAIKNGEGTFTLSMLNPMEHIEVNKGVLKLTRDYAFESDGMFQAAVYGDGSHGQFQVEGQASLAGDFKVVRGHGRYLNGTTYDVLAVSAGVQSGTGFNQIDMPDATPLLSFSCSQTGQAMQVQAHVENFATVAGNSNQQAVADTLDRLLADADGDMSLAMGQIQAMHTASDFSQAFNSMSPAAYNQVSLSSISGVQQYSRSVRQRFQDIKERQALKQDSQTSEPILVAYSGPDPRLLRDKASTDRPLNGGWIKAFHQAGDQDPDGNADGYDYEINGISLGLDRMFGQNCFAGLSVGFSQNDLEADRDDSDSDIDTIMGTLYTGYLTPLYYLNVMLSYGSNDYETQRVVMASQTVNSEHTGDLWSGTIGAGMTIDLNKWWLEPYGHFQYTRLDEEGFSETGSGAGLTVESRTTESLVSELGLRLSRAYRCSHGIFLPAVGVGWHHDYDIDDHMISAAYVDSPDASFSIEGQPVNEDGLIVDAGLTYRGNGGIVTSLKYNADLRDDFSAHSVYGMVRIEF